MPIEDSSCFWAKIDIGLVRCSKYRTQVDIEVIIEIMTRQITHWTDQRRMIVQTATDIKDQRLQFLTTLWVRITNTSMSVAFHFHGS